MAIVKLTKLTLFGLKSEKKEALTKLQMLGGSHLIPLNKSLLSLNSSSKPNYQKQSTNALTAVKYLQQCAKKRHQVHSKDNFNLHTIVQQTLNIKASLRDLMDQRDFLTKRIEEVKPWGDFTLAKEEELGDLKCWFYIIPKRLINQLANDLIFQIVHEDNIHSYVVILAEQEPSVASVPTPRTHTGIVPLSQLINDLHIVKLAIEDKQAERESLTRWITLITLSLTENENNIALKEANSLTLDNQDFFTIQTWIPSIDRARFKRFAKENELAVLVENITPEDSPPTLLKNAESVAGGEELIKFYQTPAYHAWDPSTVVFFSFSLFFAIILSDAGYAIVFALILGIKWNKLGARKQGRRLRFLASITIVFSVVWGVITGGYFGHSPPTGSIADTLKILDINDFDKMMRLSIAVGALHIILANLIKAYQHRNKKSALAALGWICLVIGGFLLWLGIETLQTTSYSFLIFGCFLLLIFSSERDLNKPTDFLWQLLDGVRNITGITKLFGDILSYMRLFALGLASASLALTFNQLAEQVYSSISGLGLLFSMLILILGHTLNLLLCLMSGVVHGLRLNFIEFYNWSVSDEGYPFIAFSKKRGN